MFGQILAPEDEVEDPDDDSQWDGSKLRSSGPGETAREGPAARISSALIGLAMESWTRCCVRGGRILRASIQISTSLR